MNMRVDVKYHNILMQAIELRVENPNFVNDFLSLMFAVEYRECRRWPTTNGRSEKLPMPIQIDRFTKTYMSKHVRDKMNEESFLKR